MVRNKKLHK